MSLFTILEHINNLCSFYFLFCHLVLGEFMIPKQAWVCEHTAKVFKNGPNKIF